MAWIELTQGNGEKILVNTDLVLRISDREERHGGGSDLHLAALDQQGTNFFTVKEKRNQITMILAAAGQRVGR